MAMASRAPSCYIKIMFGATDIARHTETASQTPDTIATHAAGAANHVLHSCSVVVCIRGRAHQHGIGSVSLRQALMRC